MPEAMQFILEKTMINILDPKKAKPDDGITPLSSFFPAQAGRYLHNDVTVMALMDLRNSRERMEMLDDFRNLLLRVENNALDTVSVLTRFSLYSRDREICRVTGNWLGDLIGKMIFYGRQLDSHRDPLSPEIQEELE
jgi:hypothetical protein